MRKIYVGCTKEYKLEVFTISKLPTYDTTPMYLWVIGEFKTLRGAFFYKYNGWNNPHVQHVRDAERIAKDINFIVGILKPVVR